MTHWTTVAWAPKLRHKAQVTYHIGLSSSQVAGSFSQAGLSKTWKVIGWHGWKDLRWRGRRALHGQQEGRAASVLPTLWAPISKLSPPSRFLSPARSSQRPALGPRSPSAVHQRPCPGRWNRLSGSGLEPGDHQRCPPNTGLGGRAGQILPTRRDSVQPPPHWALLRSHQHHRPQLRAHASSAPPVLRGASVLVLLPLCPSALPAPPPGHSVGRPWISGP